MNNLRLPNKWIILWAMVFIFLAGCTIDPELIGTIRDGDGNRYSIVKIGKQKWMASNLRTTSFNDGTPIPQLPGVNDWKGTTKPAYCWYGADSTLEQKKLFGAYYNGYVIDTAANGGRNVCPVGWHVPTRDDWNAMFDDLGGGSQVVDKLRRGFTDEWAMSYGGETNKSGFTATPGGYRSGAGVFDEKRSMACWWTSSYNSNNGGISTGFYIGDTAVRFFENLSRKIGSNVRCVKDE
jgi:uncharacterized protein (TIGR02145 family)